MGSGRAWVVHPASASKGKAGKASSRSPEARLEEARGLAEAIELEVVGAEIAVVRKRSPATLIGDGKVGELAATVQEHEIELMVVDGTLTPVQQRNLERRLKCKVIDRTGLILEIFGRRARTREGVMQVELAALAYQRSRLVRSWTHLERQRGGKGFLGGPGESQIELDRRKIGERIDRLELELVEVKRTRGLHRESRQKVPYPTVALVGYTNAGKSTLFNRMTGAGVLAQDQLFATLDPTMRQVALPDGLRVILSDTVGFISDLPTSLVAAFRATLEEVLAADIVLHVRDLSHPDHAAQADDVGHVLDELGLRAADLDRRLIEVWNKIDRLDEPARAGLEEEAGRAATPAVAVSAITGDGIDGLLAGLEQRLTASHDVVTLTVGYADGALLAWLHRNGRIVERADDDSGTRVSVALTGEARARLVAQLGHEL